MRVIVHPGFHKTATSTVQTQLREARDWLAPDWAIGLRADFPDVPTAARAYCETGDPIELGLFQAGLADWLEALDLQGSRGIVISAEGLCGIMPGRMGTDIYTAAPQLMATLVATLRLVLGAQAQMTIYLSTRAAGDWLHSLHWQLVRTGTLGLTSFAFRSRMAPGADLEAVAKRIARAVAPETVVTRPIEQTRALPEGPIAPILDLMGLDPAQRARFANPERRNARPHRLNTVALSNKLALINAETPHRDLAEARKRRVLAEAWRAHEAGEEST